MNWTDFVNLMKYMSETYGVPFGYGDEEHEGELPETITDCEDAWFECCNCSEPILYCDWKDELVSPADDWEVYELCCPICKNSWDDNYDFE